MPSEFTIDSACNSRNLHLKSILRLSKQFLSLLLRELKSIYPNFFLKQIAKEMGKSDSAIK